jgi:hypothetical protein
MPLTFQQRLSDLGYLSYEEYLQSPHWLSTRTAYMRVYGWDCKRCDGKASQLHHQTYDRLGHERLDDLASVCDGCHEIVHARPSGNLRVVPLRARKKHIHPRNPRAKKASKRAAARRNSLIQDIERSVRNRHS